MSKQTQIAQENKGAARQSTAFMLKKRRELLSPNPAVSIAHVVWYVKHYFSGSSFNHCC